MISDPFKLTDISWTSYLPTKILFGLNTLNKIDEICSNYGKSALIVSGNSPLKTGLLNRCVTLLETAGIHVKNCNAITSEPTVHQVNEIVSYIRNHKFDMLIALGGGSVIDATKAAAVIAIQGGKAEEYLTENKKLTDKTIPVIAIPTTAGTGAETSKGAIISWPEKELKGGIRGNMIFPKAAIVDPELTLTLSPEFTRITGFDIFTHAVETYLSRKATYVTALFSRQAIKAVTQYLPKILLNPNDLEARANLSFYSMLMGYNLANSSTCLPHRLQYPLGVLTGTPHALGLAALYPAWVKTTYQKSSKRFDDIAEWMGGALDTEIENKPSDIYNLLILFMKTVDLLPAIQDLGITENMCDQLAKLVSGNLANDPWWHEEADISVIYREAFNFQPD